MSKYVMITIEAAFEIENTDLHEAIQSSLDDIRGWGAAKVVGSKIFEDDVQYELWYKDDKRSIFSITVPTPTVIDFD